MLNDAWRAVAELAASQHSAFTRAQAAVHQIDRDRLATAVRAHRVMQVTPTVFVFTGVEGSYEQQLAIAVLALPGSRASHRAASWLNAFDGASPGFIELSVLAGHRAVPPFPGVIVHRVRALPKSDLIVVDGIPCTGIARSLTDLGAVVDEDAVLRALIGLHAKGHSMLWFRTTAERVDAPGRNGARVLLALLDRLKDAGTVPDSWLEEVIRRIIEHPGLPPLVSQYELRNAKGRLVAVFDHAFPDARLGIEGHSKRFHFGPVYEPQDADRDMRVGRFGWDVQYLGWFAQRQPAEVVEALAEIVSHRLPTAA